MQMELNEMSRNSFPSTKAVVIIRLIAGSLRWAETAHTYLQCVTIDKEALAIVAAVKKFRDYICGRHVEIRTDHSPLLGLLAHNRATPQMVSPRLLCRRILLNAYDYELVHYAGKSIANANALSRLPASCPEFPIPSPGDNVLMLETMQYSPLTPDDISQMTAKDPEGRLHVLEALLSAHRGIVRMKALARSCVWWPKWNDDIEVLVRTCSVCQMSHHAPGQLPTHPWEVTRKPWERLHIDFTGPVDGKIFLLLLTHSQNGLRLFGSTTPAIVINNLRGIFATHGPPRVMSLTMQRHLRLKSLACSPEEMQFVASYHSSSKRAV
ncbi:LOW QUALITY PROTEIN: hypothetical protein M514_10266 [Trichuris suis]|uniref:RNA-directed DNA polymerase n=1 Tax=Trichuris suis TaxID=68888 RepID=A0A085N9P8_9BILA|nr:LOW QUALITY PROTEIN: hypothetical protein M514_10266 [Trichuris suis]